MTRVMSWCACAAVAFGVGLGGCADRSARREILRNNEALFHAIAARDVATLDGIAAPDFQFEQQGQRGDRRIFLDAVARREATVEWITNDELRLSVAGEHALLCGVQRARVVVGGQRVADEARFCDRWEKRGGRWQVTFAGEPDRPR